MYTCTIYMYISIYTHDYIYNYTCTYIYTYVSDEYCTAALPGPGTAVSAGQSAGRILPVAWPSVVVATRWLPMVDV